MQRFKILVVYNGLQQVYLIAPQPDEIFIALPQRTRVKEKFFLTKGNGHWVGDMANKKLLEKIGDEIDKALAVEKAIAAMAKSS